MKKWFLSALVAISSILCAEDLDLIKKETVASLEPQAKVEEKQKPVIIAELPGLLGNRLFAFCMANILAENMGWKVLSEPIYGFPETYSCSSNKAPCEYPTEIINDAPNFELDINPIINNKSLRNIKISGYFQGYKTLKPYTNQIRNKWLKIAPELLRPRNERDIVVHVRAQYPDCYFLPFEYYEKALAQTSYERVYICTDDPSHPFLENFKKYNPIIVSTRNLEATIKQRGPNWPEISKMNLDDFLFMHSFDKIVIGFSTYSWWAAFLSDAKEIYAPYPLDKKYQYYIVEEPRYHYIETPIGK